MQFCLQYICQIVTIYQYDKKICASKNNSTVWLSISVTCMSSSTHIIWSWVVKSPRDGLWDRWVLNTWINTFTSHYLRDSLNQYTPYDLGVKFNLTFALLFTIFRYLSLIYIGKESSENGFHRENQCILGKKGYSSFINVIFVNNCNSGWKNMVLTVFRPYMYPFLA